MKIIVKFLVVISSFIVSYFCSGCSRKSHYLESVEYAGIYEKGLFKGFDTVKNDKQEYPAPLDSRITGGRKNLFNNLDSVGFFNHESDTIYSFWSCTMNGNYSWCLINAKGDKVSVNLDNYRERKSKFSVEPDYKWRNDSYINDESTLSERLGFELLSKWDMDLLAGSLKICGNTYGVSTILTRNIIFKDMVGSVESISFNDPIRWKLPDE